MRGREWPGRGCGGEGSWREGRDVVVIVDMMRHHSGMEPSRRATVRDCGTGLSPYFRLRCHWLLWDY